MLDRVLGEDASACTTVQVRGVISWQRRESLLPAGTKCENLAVYAPTASPDKMREWDAEVGPHPTLVGVVEPMAHRWLFGGIA